MDAQHYYIGLMSGTSADAVDVVAVHFADGKLELACHHSTPIPADLRQRIHALATPSHDEIDQLGGLDRELGILFSEAIQQLLSKNQLSPQQIIAIGSHGQTIRHRPPGTAKTPFTLQIGDPNTIAQMTGITTVADFRRRDMAVGGQGAPLVPAFHKAVFHSADRDRAIVNIGGMSNITWLPKTGTVSGFDTGPGNVLLDAWALKHLGKPFDAKGSWAASGTPNHDLLNALVLHPFFAISPPKSTGREAFNLAWLESTIDAIPHSLSAEDVQATLICLTAKTIVDSLTAIHAAPDEVFVCGGGAYNETLLNELERQAPKSRITSTQELGVAPQWVEAMAFAWLAKQTLERQPGNLTSVTGAAEAVILGGVYFG